MARRFISVSQNVQQIQSIVDINPSRVSTTIYRESSPIDEFYCYTEERSDLDKPIKFYRDPIYELFNQERLSRLGRGSLEDWVKSMSIIKGNPLNELREKCSDSELLSVMKSRYCQTPSEVMNWARYLNNNLSELEKQVSLAREEQEKLAAAAAKESANVVTADSVATQTTI